MTPPLLLRLVGEDSSRFEEGYGKKENLFLPRVDWEGIGRIWNGARPIYFWNF